jgi:hypothetical protein
MQQERDTATSSDSEPPSGADPKDQPDTAAEVDPDVATLLGLRPTGADSIPDASEVDTLGEITDTRIYEGELEARAPGGDQPDEDQAENLESLVADEMRDGETDDAMEAAEEGLTWVPPIDPPTRADERGDAEIAAGFATSAADEPFDEDHHGTLLPAQDEVEARVIEALLADSATTGLVDGLEIDAEGGRIRIAGTVEDLEDEDAIIAVAESVPGVTSVDSRLDIAALDAISPNPEP